jgi:hypothetical protein
MLLVEIRNAQQTSRSLGHVISRDLHMVEASENGLVRSI